MKNIVYISDNSITHPILNSQGIPHLISISNNGFKITIVTFETYNRFHSPNFDQLRNQLIKNNINHYPVRLPRNLFPSGRIWVWFLGFFKVMKICFKIKPAIIHTRSYPPTLLALMAKLFFKVKILFDMRGIFVEEMLEAKIIKHNSILFHIENCLEKLYIKYSDKLISVSNKHLKYCNDKFKALNISSKNVLIRNTVDINNFRIRENRLNDCNSPRFIYAGHFTSKYDIKSIFELFRESIKFFNEASLKILTYLDEEPFHHLIDSSFPTIKKYIKVMKSKPQDIPGELLHADVGFVLLNPFKSNYVSAPIKLAEYLAAGLIPIISENVGDSEEILSKYNVCVITKNNNYQQTLAKLKTLLIDPETSIRCRNVAKKEFNITNAIEEYTRIYNDLLEN